jgi:hypothetical protein
VLSISRERPGSTALVRPSLRRTHSCGNLPYIQQKCMNLERNSVKKL